MLCINMRRERLLLDQKKAVPYPPAVLSLSLVEELAAIR